ncbi:hypothetical protein ACWCSD_38850 [Nonomuraea sp. NPDC001684]
MDTNDRPVSDGAAPLTWTIQPGPERGPAEWKFGPNDLLEHPGHDLVMQLDTEASAQAEVPLHIGTCSCGGMQPTPPWHKQSVGWEFNYHIEGIQAEIAKQARIACLARNGGSHLWVLELHPEETPALSCSDPECRDASDDLPPDYTVLLVGDVIVDGRTVHVENDAHDAPDPVEAPVSVNVVVEEHGGNWVNPVEYSVWVELSRRETPKEETL